MFIDWFNKILNISLTKYYSMNSKMVPHLSFFLSVFIFRERERRKKRKWKKEQKRELQEGAEGEGERQNPKQNLHCQPGAQCRSPTQEPWDHELSWNQESDALPAEPPRCPTAEVWHSHRWEYLSHHPVAYHACVGVPKTIQSFTRTLGLSRLMAKIS